MDMRLQEIIIYTHPIEGLWEQYRERGGGMSLRFLRQKIDVVTWDMCVWRGEGIKPKIHSLSFISLVQD